MESISDKMNNSGLPMGLRASTITNEAIACATAKMKASYQEYLNMAKNRVNVRHDDSMTKDETAVAERQETEEKVYPGRNLESPGRNMTQEEMDKVFDPETTAAIQSAFPNGETPAKKARKKPDRTNPPWYEVYSEKEEGKEVKLEGKTDTAGKALKFIYLHAARVAGDARKLFVVRCKRLTDAELLD